MLAEALEARDFEVYYQSATRSPVLTGGAIRGSLTFADEHGEGVTKYLHNPPPHQAQIVAVYDSELSAQRHELSTQLPLKAWLW